MNPTDSNSCYAATSMYANKKLMQITATTLKLKVVLGQTILNSIIV